MAQTTNSKKPEIYWTQNGAIELKVDSNAETIWASKKDIVNIFEKDQSVISRYIKNIFKDFEVDKNSTCAFFAQVQNEGGRKVKRDIEFYNLDIILAVGYRTNSAQAIAFRRWATKILKQHITQGYTINKNCIEKNYNAFMLAVEDVKLLTKTLLIAIFNPNEKDKLIGLVLLLSVENQQQDQQEN